MDKEKDARYVVMVSKKVQQRTMLEKLLAVLGMKHSQEEKTFTHLELKELAPKIEPLEKDIRAIFGLRSSRKKEFGFSVKACYLLLKTVWDTWAGSELESINERRVRCDGKQVRIFDYRFVPCGVWESIREAEEL